MAMQFTKAVRRQARLRMALTGPSGSGKTYSALQLAKGLGGRVAVIDTEHGSASLYSDLMEFDTLALEAPYSPERYIDAIAAAEAAGYDVLVIDSITHEWNGRGGILEIHDKVTRTTARGNSYTAWADVTPRHNAFIDAMLQSKLHLIVTMRSKQDFIISERNGKSVPTKVGLAPVQREGMEYEFTAVLDVSLEHLAIASKDRTRLFAGTDARMLSEADGQRLREWLEQGEQPAPIDHAAQSQLADLRAALPDAPSTERVTELVGSAKGLAGRVDEQDLARFLAAARARFRALQQPATAGDE